MIRSPKLRGTRPPCGQVASPLVMFRDGIPRRAATTLRQSKNGLLPMTSEQLWLVALIAASIAVVVIALLLGLVINALRQIDRHAARTHTAAKQIAQNTVALWALEQTNRDLIAIRDAARRASEVSRGGPAASPVGAVTHKVQEWLDHSPDEDGSS